MILVGIVVAIVLVALVAVVVVVFSRSRSVDGVEQFQRQIDALSPEARRPVVDQVHQLDDRAGTEHDEPDENDVTDVDAPRDPDGGPAGDPDGT